MQVNKSGLEKLLRLQGHERFCFSIWSKTKQTSRQRRFFWVGFLRLDDNKGLLLLRVHSRFPLRRRQRLIGRLLGLLALLLLRRRSCSGPRQRAVDAHSLSVRRSVLPPTNRPPSARPRRIYLRDHPADVARVARQQDGVGLFGEVREGGDVLLCDAQRRRGVSVLQQTCIEVEGGCPGGVPGAAAAHLAGQSLRQHPDGLGFGLRFGQDRLGLAWERRPPLNVSPKQPGLNMGPGRSTHPGPG